MSGWYFYVWVEREPDTWVIGHLHPTKGWKVHASGPPRRVDFDGKVGRTVFPYRIRHRAPAMPKRRGKDFRHG